MRTAAAGEPGVDLIACENLVKTYRTGSLEVLALQGLDLRIAEGEMAGIVGKSGSGKSTLLNILGGNDIPTTGTARVAGFDLLALSPRQTTHYHRQVVGFVWQQTSRNLLPYLSALQNVEQPLYYAGVPRRVTRRRAAALLDLVGLGRRLHHQPTALSGGEQQRVAIAIALANGQRLLLADEPTGSLDSATAQEILDMFKLARRELGVTVVVVTHDPAVADSADRTIAIRDGRTSVERVRVEQGSTATTERATHLEFVVDRAGRLQLPQEYPRALHIGDRAVVRLEDGRIVITPAPAGGP